MHVLCTVKYKLLSIVSNKFKIPLPVFEPLAHNKGILRHKKAEQADLIKEDLFLFASVLIIQKLSDMKYVFIM